MTDPALCSHANVVPHPVPEWLRWFGPLTPYPVMRCLDCDLRGEMVSQ